MSDSLCTIDTNRRKNLLFNIPPTRFTPLSPYGTGLTQYQLDMRRKVEILQYNKNDTGTITKKQAFVQVVKGASQRRTYSKSYIANFDGNTTICPPTISTAANIPGPAFYLFLDPSVPLYNYVTTRTYATENSEDTETMWIYDTSYNIVSNFPKLLTLNIRKPIDQSVYTYTFSTSIGLSVTGNSDGHPAIVDVSGTFSTKIFPSDVIIEVRYGDVPITLISEPLITFGAGFITDVSGNSFSYKTPNTFGGNIYLGNMTVSNLSLATSPGYTYDIYVKYIPSNTFKNIDNYNSTFISGLQPTFVKQELGLEFKSSGPSTSIDVFSFSGI